MTTRQHAIGRWGEDLAARYLHTQGYRILERNLRTAYGEIDILAQEDDMLVFIEVKTRTSLAFGLPESSVNLIKQAHIRSAALAYIQAHPEYDEVTWRVDVLAILQRKGDPQPQISHFEDVIS